MNTRAHAAVILQQVTQQQRSLSAVLTDPKNTLPNNDISFMKELCYGTLRWYYPLHSISQKLLNSPLKSKDQDIHCLLLAGLYQLFYLNTPDYAAVSETVNAAKQLNKPWAGGLLNKVMHRAIREKAQLQLPGVDQEAEFAHPAWFIEKIRQAWPEQWQSILKANNDYPPMFVRVNLRKTSRDDYLSKLTDAEIKASIVDDCNTALLLHEPLPVDKVPGFREGLCSVQDVSGQYATELLDLQPEQTVLDACAAPGSKTSHMLEQHQDLAKLVAIDKDATRLFRIKENIERLQLGHLNVQLKLADASHTDQWWDGVPFDRILLDAPCSATGVIRRHPDIKLLRRKTDIVQLQHEQLKLLHRLWPLLAPNGKLLYTTCSVLPEENETVVGQFLKANQDAKVVPITLNGGLSLEHGYQILPTLGGADGFYYCCFTK